jgi:hypothetical protein
LILDHNTMTISEKDTTHILETLQDKGDYFSRLCAIERKRVSDLEDAIRHITVDLEKLRNDSKASATEVLSLHVITPAPVKKKCDGANVSKEAQQSTTKILSIFEAKLNRLLQKKSDVINHVKKLKSEINHHRRLRVQTDIQHSKFEVVLAETKANIERLLNESTLIVEERDKLLEKKATLERINIEEQTLFQEEYEKMGNFIKVQNQALEEALLRERKRDFLDKKGQLDESMLKLRQGEMSLDEELDMARQVGTLTNFVLSEQNSLSGIEKKIHSYELIFEDLKKMTGSSSMEDVISTYVAQEEEMFSLYNFIQTVNSDIDMVLESTARVEADIKAYKEQQEIQNEQRMNIVRDLEAKHSQLLDAIQSTEDEINVSQESIAQISKKVSSLFFKLQCDQMDIQKVTQTNASSGQGNHKSKQSTMHGARNPTNIALIVSQGVSESNVLDYMGCIEQRCVDIIAEYIDHAPNKPDFRSTAGPSAPVHWNASPMLDLNEVNEDDYLAVETNPAAGSAVSNSVSEDVEAKPVDLANYKKSLQKKLGLGNSKDGKDRMMKPVKLSGLKSPKTKAKH